MNIEDKTILNFKYSKIPVGEHVYEVIPSLC